MEKEPGWGVWFFLFFLFQTPIYTNQYGSSIAKTACRKKQRARLELLFIMKILIRCKTAVIDKFNLTANSIMTGMGTLYAAYNLGVDIDKIAQGVGYAVETVKEWLGLES